LTENLLGVELLFARDWHALGAGSPLSNLRFCPSEGFPNIEFDEANEGGFMARIRSHGVSAFALLVVIAGFAATPSYAQNFSVLYQFGSKTGDAMEPAGIVAQRQMWGQTGRSPIS